MTHYTNTDNPIDFPKKKEIPMLERFAAQSLAELDGELIFSKEKFAELIVRECIEVSINNGCGDFVDIEQKLFEHFGVDE